MDELVNKTLGQFQITRELGRGGMAIVYEAFQPALQRQVAIKVLLPSLSSDAAFVQRFQHEAIAAASLRHSNIVTIHDVGSQDRYSFIVMEYLEGRPLSDVIRAGGPMPLARICKIIEQVAQALDYAHEHGFVHRDIKPGNVMLSENDHATLTDFGIARALVGTHLTQTGTMIGTPEYMSPEQVTGAEIDRHTDVYALGIVAYEMVTGEVPFSGTTVSVLYRQAHEPPPPLRGRVPGVSAAAESVILRALAKRRDDRYATAGQFAQALTVAVTGQSAAAPSRQTAPTVGMPQPVYTPPSQPVYTPLPQPVYTPPPAYTPPQPVYAPQPQPMYAPSPAVQRSGGLSGGLLWLLGGAGVAAVLCAVLGGAVWLFSRQSSSVTPRSQAGSTVIVPRPVTVIVSATPDKTSVPNATPIPTSTPAAQTTPTPNPDQVQAAVRNAVERFQKAKEYSQKTGDISRLSQDLAGQALDRQVQLVNQTKTDNCYWDIWLDGAMRYEFLETRGDNYVRVKVFKTETRHKYCNGKLVPSSSVDKESYDTTYAVEQINGKWYVTQRE